MTEAGGGMGCVAGLDFGRQLVQLALGPDGLQPFVLDEGNPGRVVSPVFQTAQAVHDHGDGWAVAAVSDYSAHKPVSEILMVQV
jgi:hypothetical protein